MGEKYRDYKGDCSVDLKRKWFSWLKSLRFRCSGHINGLMNPINGLPIFFLGSKEHFLIEGVVRSPQEKGRLPMLLMSMIPKDFKHKDYRASVEKLTSAGGTLSSWLSFL